MNASAHCTRADLWLTWLDDVARSLQRRSKQGILAIILSTIAGVANAAPGWTESAPPSAVETVRSQGILILGAYGNPGTACTNPDAIWVSETHPQYEAIIASATTAVATGLKLRAYVHTCATIGWHGGTFNELTGDGAIFLEK